MRKKNLMMKKKLSQIRRISKFKVNQLKNYCKNSKKIYFSVLT